MAAGKNQPQAVIAELIVAACVLHVSVRALLVGFCFPL